MPDALDLALEDLAAEVLCLEDELVTALAERALYRWMLRMVLAQETTHLKHLARAQQRIRQLGGLEAWHPEERADYEGE